MQPLSEKRNLSLKYCKAESKSTLGLTKTSPTAPEIIKSYLQSAQRVRV
jgi:hypothetical protein